MKRKIALCLTLLLLSFGAYSAPVTYDISWTGLTGFSMTGSFSFDDSLLGTGAINESSLLSFNIEGFSNGTLIGSFDPFADSPLLGSDIFNFNFDTTTNQFLIDGTSLATSQQWGTDISGTSCSTTGFGFESDSVYQSVCFSPLGGFLGQSSIPTSSSTLVATRVTPVPLPASGPLSLLGLGLLAIIRCRKPRSA